MIEAVCTIMRSDGRGAVMLYDGGTFGVPAFFAAEWREVLLRGAATGAHNAYSTNTAISSRSCRWRGRRVGTYRLDGAGLGLK